MKSVIQIEHVTTEAFYQAIDTIVENRLSALLKEQESETLTVLETSKMLGVTQLTIHNYIKKGILRASKIGRRIVISRTDIEDALKQVKSLKYKRTN